MNGNIEPLKIKAYNFIIEEISKGHVSKEGIEILKKKYPKIYGSVVNRNLIKN